MMLMKSIQTVFQQPYGNLIYISWIRNESEDANMLIPKKNSMIWKINFHLFFPKLSSKSRKNNEYISKIHERRKKLC